ncbi:MAG: hypothetical protein JWP89_1206 [Schlesneria sp.]|nr:hypothetical protein [Schlesneria sp.]
MTVSESIQRMTNKLVELYKIDFGYPLGENVIRKVDRRNGIPSAFVSTNGSTWLNELYSACDGISFPDVHVGYFLKPIERVISFDRSSEPTTVVLDHEFSVLPFGSTGGGGLFVVGCDLGNVMLLPPGPLHDGRYCGIGQNVKHVAATVPIFVDLLSSDLSAFVNDDRDHIYIA